MELRLCLFDTDTKQEIKIYYYYLRNKRVTRRISILNFTVRHVFKAKLSYLITNRLCNADHIPYFFEDAADFIRTKLGALGLFTANVNLVKFKEAYNDINKLKPYTFDNVHVACHIIMRFLKEMPESLLPISMYESYFLENIDGDDFIVNVWMQLTGNHRALLSYLMDFLKEVVSHQVCHFTAQHIADAIFDCIIHIKQENINKEQHHYFINLIAYMIENFKYIKVRGDELERAPFLAEDFIEGAGVISSTSSSIAPETTEGSTVSDDDSIASSYTGSEMFRTETRSTATSYATNSAVKHD